MIISTENNPFGRNLSIGESFIIERDIMHIRFRYFMHRGLKHITHLKKRRILNAMDDYVKNGSMCQYQKVTMEDWKDFVEMFDQEDGIEFFEFHAWL